jgi:MinD superfamily P-loop ATPase
VEQGTYRQVTVVTGVLNPGEASGVPVVRAVLGRAAPENELTVIDCPPGSACPVMESISQADYCILVAEPTVFGFHNFQMAYELAGVLEKPCGVIINKAALAYEPLDDFCRERQIPVLLRIPYRETLARMGAQGEIAVESDTSLRNDFRDVLQKIKAEVHN